MDQARFQRVQDLFNECVELPPGTRTAHAEHAAAGDIEVRDAVLAMLKEDGQAVPILDHGIAWAAGQVFGATADVSAIGNYRIVRHLGEGGSGMVHLAERRDLGTHVAIKVLRDAWLSPARRDQFTIEQQTLARLTHASIARLYDAGALPDGTPWIVMEYVDGVAITTYCREKAVPIADRLRLLRDVGVAVQHAHRHLIVHRDIKPSNVLVSQEGVVKLLDFGIAKHLDAADKLAARTRTIQRRMTPAYAAPEQIRGDGIGLHTDVYGLGVLLYELLTGGVPFDVASLTPAAAEALLLQQEPRKPSAAALASASSSHDVPPDATAVGRTAWTDLDVLCLTAMHKDPARRYASVDAMLRDIDHYLAGEPLEARADALGYRAAKFVRRNRTPIAAAAAAAITIASATVFYTSNLARARDAALTEAARARRLQGLMSNLFTGGEDTTAPAERLRVVDVLDRGVLEAENLKSEPIVQAELFHTIGGLYQQLGRLGEADTLLARALAQRRTLFGSASAEVSRSLVGLGLLRNDQGQYEEAERLTREGLDMARRHLPPGDPEIPRALTAVGRVLEERGSYDNAAATLQEAIRLHAGSATESADLVTSLRHLGNVQFYAGNFDAAGETFDRVLAMSRRVYGERHALVAEDLINVGAVHFERGRYADAERDYRDALPITEGWYGGEHPQTAANLTMLARALNMLTRYEEAADLLTRAVAVQERVFGPVHPRVASAVNEIGIVALQNKRYDEAASAFQRMADIYRAVYDGKHYLLGTAIANRASVFNAQEQWARAEPLFREAIALFSETQSPTHLNTGIARIKLGRALLGQRRYAEAEVESLAGYEILTPQTSPTVTWLKSAREDLVKVYAATNQPEKAARFQKELDITAAQ